jgi:hypothetical protein
VGRGRVPLRPVFGNASPNVWRRAYVEQAQLEQAEARAGMRRGVGCIVVSEKETPVLLVNLV